MKKSDLQIGVTFLNHAGVPEKVISRPKLDKNREEYLEVVVWDHHNKTWLDNAPYRKYLREDVLNYLSFI
jgi:hypothetical protein